MKEKSDSGTERKYDQKGGQNAGAPKVGVRNEGLTAAGDGAGSHRAYKASKGSSYMPKKSMD